MHNLVFWNIWWLFGPPIKIVVAVEDPIGFRFHFSFGPSTTTDYVFSIDAKQASNRCPREREWQ